MATEKQIKNHAAYCKKVASNSQKNEYRGNDNAAKHITPTGIWFDGYTMSIADEAAIENHIAAQTPEDWLRFIENEHLHQALRMLSPKDLAFVHEMFFGGYSQAQMGEKLGVSQQAISKRWLRIKKKLETFFKKGL